MLYKQSSKIIIFISFTVISLLVFIFFFNIMHWLEEQFSVWCNCMEEHSAAKTLRELPYYPVIIPISIIYFVLAIIFSKWIWKLRKNILFVILNVPLTASNLITATMLCLMIAGHSHTEFLMGHLAISFFAILIFVAGAIKYIINLIKNKRS